MIDSQALQVKLLQKKLASPLAIIISLKTLMADNLKLTWGDVQADLRLCCLHMAKTGFLMTWLKYQLSP